MNEEPGDPSTPAPIINKGGMEGNLKADVKKETPKAKQATESTANEGKKPESPSLALLREFETGVDERCMWIDPVREQASPAGSVLLGDVIKKYVVQFNLLFDKSTFDEGKLKGASYTMTPAENDAWRFIPKADGSDNEKVALRKGRDTIGDYYIVPRNSLVYIKLKQKIRLPFYMIGRHNLKIRYVYKGLLLGTGPQVDPGFEGNLFIPLHNFTTSNVNVYINGRHNSFVSIDFVRTTSFLEGSEVSSHVKTVKDLRDWLQESKSSKVLIEEKKVEERKELEDYLEGAKPRSQLDQFELDYVTLVNKTRFDYDALVNEVRGEIKVLKRWSAVERWALAVAVFGLILSALAYLFSFSVDLRTQGKDLKASVASSNVGKLENRLSILETNSTEMLGTLHLQVTNFTTIASMLTNNDAKTENHLRALEVQFLQFRRGATNSASTNSGNGP